VNLLPFQRRFLKAATGPGCRVAALSVLAANGKTAQGPVDVDWTFGDEPEAWEINGGQLVADAIETAPGKPADHLHRDAGPERHRAGRERVWMPPGQPVRLRRQLRDAWNNGDSRFPPCARWCDFTVSAQ